MRTRYASILLWSAGFLLLLTAKSAGLEYSTNRVGFACVELAGMAFGAAMIRARD